MDALLALVHAHAGPWALAAIFAAAALEYLLPPLPADSVVLAGALLVVAGEAPFVVVYGCAVVGGVLGASVHFLLGRTLGARGRLEDGRWVKRLTGEAGMTRFFEMFRRYGLWVLVLNRALPGVRGVTFLAAGAAGLPFGRSMIAGTVSHMLWIGLVLGVGVSVGDNLEKIRAAFDVYRRGVYAVAALGVVAYAGWRWARRRRAPESDS